MDTKVTIGVCVKNRENTIRETLESIISQKYPVAFIQLIIVDGCSEDNTLSIVRNLTSETQMRVEIYTDHGKGLGIARQIVLNMAISDYIVFVDSDVKLLDGFLEMHIKYMEENPNIGATFGVSLYEDGSLISSISNLFQYAIGGFSGNDATIYRTAALISVGGFDPNIKGAAEDDDLINRLKTKGWLVSVNEKAKFIHRNRTTLRDFMIEQSWFGYGGHYVAHKSSSLRPTWRQNLIGASGYGLKMALNAYRKTHKKLAFLIPLRMILADLSWWFGFIKAHIDGYGHKKCERPSPP